MHGHVYFAVERNGVYSGAVYGDGQHLKPDRGINSVLVVQVMLGLFALTGAGAIPCIHINLLRPGHNSLRIVH